MAQRPLVHAQPGAQAGTQSRKMGPSVPVSQAGNRRAAPQRSPSARKRAGSPLIAALLCCSVIAAGLLAGCKQQGNGKTPASKTPVSSGAGGEYALRQTAPGETTLESKEGTTGGQPVEIALSDGSQVSLPATARPVTVKFVRQSNTVKPPASGLQTSGSMRTLEFDPSQVDDSFVPTLTIPAKELGKLDPATVNIARVSDTQVNGELLKDQVMYLPFQQDTAGNVVVVDATTRMFAKKAASSRQTTGVQLALFEAQGGQRMQVNYVVMTFQGHLEWSVAPRLVRMIPDASLTSQFRRPADVNRDKDLLQKPVVNVIVLLHGHSEEEKDGNVAPSADAPWNVAYKLNVWNEFYRTFLETQQDLVDCTAFYEFIYPTFRSIYSPIAHNPADPLGQTLAEALRAGAENDGHQLEKLRTAKMRVNLYLTAHSMGGLVAREGIRQFDDAQKSDFQELVTWGTPHHGSPLETLAYVLRGPYLTTGGGVAWSAFNAVLGTAAERWYVETRLRLDTPGVRDLRWDNVQPLRLDTLFRVDTASIPRGANPDDYNLTNGAFLYNVNLPRLNQADPYRNGEKYRFLYGVTSKRFGDEYLLRKTARGASLIEALLRDPNAAVPDVSGRAGDSDGAVPLASEAGLYIADFHADNVGDVDHEEYFSPSSDVLYGGKVASWTFDRLGLQQPRCQCAEISVDKLGSLKPGAELKVNAHFTVNRGLDPTPGKRIKQAQALFYIGGGKSESVLGKLKVATDGGLTGAFKMPDLGSGDHALVVRADLADGTKLESPRMATSGGYWLLTRKEGIPNPADDFETRSHAATAADGELTCSCTDSGQDKPGGWKPGSGKMIVRWQPSPPAQAKGGDVWSFEMEVSGQGEGESPICSMNLVQGGVGGAVTTSSNQTFWVGTSNPQFGPGTSIQGEPKAQQMQYTFPSIEQVRAILQATSLSFDLIVQMNGYGWGTPAFKYTYVWQGP